MKNVLNLLILGLFAFVSCKNNPPQKENVQDNKIEIDTTKAIKINDYWVKPKETFEIIKIEKCKDDTLRIISCAEYVYSPFGEILNKSEFKNSLLKNFTIKDRLDTIDDGIFEFQILKLKSSQLIYFFDNDPEASTHSNIFRGNINDQEVEFLYGIRIGISKEDFLSKFFDNFPSQLLSNYNVIIFDACVQDIVHTYTFESNKLKSVNFITDSYWNVDY